MAWGPITYLGHDLYCHPFCEQMQAQQNHFLFVCLPQSNATRYEWLADFARQRPMPTLVTTRWTCTQRLTETYPYFDHPPLSDRNDDDPGRHGTQGPGRPGPTRTGRARPVKPSLYTAAHGTVPFSLSRYNSEDQIDAVIRTVPPIVAQLRKLSPYWG